MIIEDYTYYYTTQYVGDYDNPIGESAESL